MADEIKVDSKEVELRLGAIASKVQNPKPIMAGFHLAMLGKTAQTFQTLAHGGTFRGVTWKPFSPNTIGKLRPSARGRPDGKRYTWQSNLLRDTGIMAAAAGQSRRWEDNNMTLHMFTKNVAYGPRQQKMRPFLFFEIPKDQQEFQRIALDYIDGKFK